jgi:hypothetical protein
MLTYISAKFSIQVLILRNTNEASLFFPTLATQVDISELCLPLQMLSPEFDPRKSIKFRLILGKLDKQTSWEGLQVDPQGGAGGCKANFVNEFRLYFPHI